MQEIIKDSTITLFGKKIPFDLEVAWTMSDDDEDIIRETEDDETEQKHQGRPSTEEDFESSDPSVSSESGNPKTPSIDEETVKPKDSDRTTMTPKKPDKILPCPRCKSMDTKFCYYNNYNVSQPRHFCKSCQRYWTSGGTMRNVPVGAGRRKSKSSTVAATAGYPQICISDSQLHHSHHHYPISRNHGTVLSFSSDSITQGTLATMNRNVDESSSDSTVTTTMSGNRNEELISHHHHVINGYGVPVPPPWLYNMGGVPLYPFWTCHVPNPWNLTWPPPYPYSEKRFREGDDYSEEEQERPKKVHAPKTLRMDDPNEAAKSSIWATLGIKNDGVVPKGGFFKGFDKTLAPGDEDQGENNPSIMCANPAASSRSLSFHERH